eukprot:6845481-Prymnesium_polylepis.1
MDGLEFRKRRVVEFASGAAGVGVSVTVGECIQSPAFFANAFYTAADGVTEGQRLASWAEGEVATGPLQRAWRFWFLPEIGTSTVCMYYSARVPRGSRDDDGARWCLLDPPVGWN